MKIKNMKINQSIRIEKIVWSIKSSQLSRWKNWLQTYKSSLNLRNKLNTIEKEPKKNKYTKNAPNTSKYDRFKSEKESTSLNKD